MKTINKKQLLLTTLLSGATFGAAAAPSFAQQDDQIVVTGTRVERKNLEAPSPVTAIDAQELTLTNTINTEQFINSLPQLVPAFDGTSNNPGTGTASANLRGLGSNRTLVLVDGNRYVSAFGDGVVDLNSIPSSLVKRVDIVTGGASAVYGSDAMAGVVNFVLDDEFEGVEVEASYQSSEKGDAGIKTLAATMGGNFDNGRGNATVYLGYTQRDAVFAAARDFASVTNVDTGTGFAPGGSSGVPGSRVFDSNFNYTDLGFSGAANAMSTGAGATFATTNSCSGGSSLRDPDGSATYIAAAGATQNLNPSLNGDEFCGGNVTFDSSGAIIPWVDSGADTTRYNYAPVNYLQLPQERYTMAAFAKYDITDTVTAKIRGIFTSNNVPVELAPTPTFTSVTIDVATNPYLSAAQRAAFTDAAIAGGQSPNAYAIYIGRRMTEIGPRNSNQELDSYQLSGDLSGQWSEEWDWDLHAHINRVNGVQIQTGNVSISAFQTVVGDGTCNIFGQGNFTDACVTAVARTGIIQNTSEQRNMVFTTDGPVNALQSPMAENPLQLVLGAEYREERFDLRPDSVLGPDVSGFNQSLPISGRFDSYEVFGEVYMPIVEGASFAEELSVNGAFRYADYSTVGGISSYAIGAEWAPVSDIRFRGQIQRAVRAPNVVELFSPLTNGFPGAQDPCAQQGTAAAPIAATGQMSLCTAGGVPAGVYNTAFQANAQVQGLFGGNTNLSEETSDTFTVGFVTTPSAIPGLTITADYYDIEVQDAIGTVSAQETLDDCYVTGAIPAYCGLIVRSAAGTISSITLTNQNLATLTAKGIDAEVSYNFDAEDVGLSMLGGEFAFNIIGGYRLESGGQATATSTFYDCAGYFGATGSASCGEPNPEWKHAATLRHSKGALLNSLRWRYIGGTTEDDQVDGGASSGRFVTDISSKNYFDWTTQWDISDHFQLSGGVINIFDTSPPILGDCCSEQSNTFPASYNPFGRQFFVSGKMRF
ncbi:MAG: TonB-dependent receptor domain-containing protein [Alphaproteobacteria bacterium]